MSTLSLERSFYVGNLTAVALLGLQVYVSLHTCYLLANDRRLAPSTRRFYVGFSLSTLICSTISLVPELLMGDLMWLVHRYDPGGPYGYMLSQTPLNYKLRLLASVFLALQTYITGAHLLFRCYVIYNGDIGAVALPFLVYLLSLAMGIIALVQTGLPNSPLFNGNTTNFLLIWISTTTGFSVLVALLISGRILHVRRLIRIGVLPTQATGYISALSIIVESAIIYSILGIINVVGIWTGQDSELALIDIWDAALAITTQLIILRVAKGQAWTRDLAEKLVRKSSVTSGERNKDKTRSESEWQVKGIRHNDATDTEDISQV